jgi:biotin transport system permease protein
MNRVGGLLGAYRPADTPLHRTPAGAKLWGLLLAGVLVVLVPGAASGVLCLALGLAALAWVRAPIGATLRGLRVLLLSATALGAWHVWSNGWPRAVEVVGDLLGLVLLATAVTVSTPVDEVLDSLARALRPFRRVGVDADQVALAFSLMLRAIPTTVALAEETRDAARARGLERDPRARLTPFVLRVVGHARTTGEALQARGIGEDPDPEAGHQPGG